MDTREAITKTIDDMLALDEKISIFSVAEKCGVSHSLIYNRYPDLKERIKELKAVQRQRIKAANVEVAIAKLTAQNKVFKDKLKTQAPARSTTEMRTLLAHMQEIYSLYDALLEDRNKLATKFANLSE